MLLLSACASPDGTPDDSASPSSTDSVADSGTDSGGTDSGSVALIGTAPTVPKSAPDFELLNRDETPRNRDDLLGHPTVLWFYPAAQTSG